MATTLETIKKVDTVPKASTETIPSKLIVHHLDASRSTRIIWLLEELNVEYDIKNYARGADLLAPSELKKIHPLGKSPVLQNPQDGRVIAESGAIIEYIEDVFDIDYKFRPKPGQVLTDETLNYRYWLHFAEGSMSTPLFLNILFEKLTKATPFFVRPITSTIEKKVHALLIDENLKNICSLIEDHLTKNEYFASNEFTAADIQMYYQMEAVVRLQIAGPKATAWLVKLEERPAFKIAISKGGPVSK